MSLGQKEELKKSNQADSSSITPKTKVLSRYKILKYCTKIDTTIAPSNQGGEVDNVEPEEIKQCWVKDMDLKEFKSRPKEKQEGKEDVRLIQFYHQEIKADDADDSRAININNKDNIA